MDNQQRVVRVIAEQLGVAEGSITPHTQLVADLGADSLDEIELVMAIEDEFGIEIDDRQAAAVRTVADACDLISRLTA